MNIKFCYGHLNPFKLIKNNENIFEEIPSVFWSAFGAQHKQSEEK